MRSVHLICCVSATVVVAAGGPALGQRILIDVGTCWSDGSHAGYGAVATDPPPAGMEWGDLLGGPSDFQAADGNWWNNQRQNPHWRDCIIDLCATTSSVATGIKMDINQWSTCDEGEQVAGNTAVSNLYPEKAQTDCRWWDHTTYGPPIQRGAYPGQMAFWGLDPEIRYDFTFYSYITSGQSSTLGPFTTGTIVYTIADGSVVSPTSVELDPVDNTTRTVSIDKVVPWSITWHGRNSGTVTDPGGVIVELRGKDDQCMCLINVVEIEVRPWHRGDATKNDVVDVLDLARLANNFGKTSAEWGDGDFNGDGVVDVLDLAAIANNFGWSDTGGGDGDGEVPEPASAAALLLAAPALLRLRRRRAPPRRRE